MYCPTTYFSFVHSHFVCARLVLHSSSDFTRSTKVSVCTYHQECSYLQDLLRCGIDDVICSTVFPLMGCLLRTADVIAAPAAADTVCIMALELLSLLEQSECRDFELRNGLHSVSQALLEISRSSKGSELSAVARKVDQMFDCISTLRWWSSAERRIKN